MNRPSESGLWYIVQNGETETGFTTPDAAVVYAAYCGGEVLRATRRVKRRGVWRYNNYERMEASFTNAQANA